MVNDIISTYHKVDIVIANAGIVLLRPLSVTTEDIYSRVMDTNVKGPFFLAQACASHMPSGSSIVFLSTTLCADTTVSVAHLVYCMSKGAVEQMTLVLSKGLAS